MKILDLIEDRRPADINDWSDEQLLDFIISKYSEAYSISDKSRKSDYIRGFLENATNISEDVMLQAVQFEPLLLYVFRKFNPSLRVQLAAVQGNGRVIGNLKYPAPLIQWAAFNQTPQAFYHIQPPECCIPEIRKIHEERTGAPTLTESSKLPTSEKLQYWLSKFNPIDYINLWSDNILIEYFKTRYATDMGEISFNDIFEYRNTLSDQVMLELIKLNPGFYTVLERFHPSLNVQIECLKRSGLHIYYMTNPPPLLQTVACRQNPLAINWINPIKSIDISLLKKYRDILEPDQRSYLESLEKLTESDESIDLDDPNTWSEEDQIDYLRSFPGAIKEFINPSKKLQSVAVRSDEWALSNIEDPDEDVQLAAVTAYPNSVRYIKNPSQKVKLAAVSKDGMALLRIKPEERNINIQLAAVMQDPEIIYEIDNPVPLVQTVALKKTPKAINWIRPEAAIVPELREKYKDYFYGSLTESAYDADDPNTWTEEQQIDWVRRYIERIKQINHPSKALQIAAVNEDGWAISQIKPEDQCLEAQLIVVREDGHATRIRYMRYPPPLVQWTAIKNNPKAINYIVPQSCIDPSLLEKYGSYLNESLTESAYDESDPNTWSAYDTDNPNTWTEEKQINWVSRDTIIRIRRINHPSKAVQIAAVKQDGWAISQIKPEEQCLEAQLIAVRGNNAPLIRYMRNPPPLVQWAAIKNNPKAINNIVPRSCIDPSLLKEYGHLINTQ